MRAYVLCGGKGTRLGSLTARIPKPLVTIGPYPILEHQIRNLVRDGITEMTMVAGCSAFVLIAYNGIMYKPEPVQGQEFETSLAIGYWIAPIAAVVIGVVGYLRSQVSDGKQQRKAPGTV